MGDLGKLTACTRIDIVVCSQLALQVSQSKTAQGCTCCRRRRKQKGHTYPNRFHVLGLVLCAVFSFSLTVQGPHKAPGRGVGQQQGHRGQGQGCSHMRRRERRPTWIENARMPQRHAVHKKYTTTKVYIDRIVMYIQSCTTCSTLCDRQIKKQYFAPATKRFVVASTSVPSASQNALATTASVMTSASAFTRPVSHARASCAHTPRSTLPAGPRGGSSTLSSCTGQAAGGKCATQWARTAAARVAGAAWITPVAPFSVECVLTVGRRSA